MVTTGAVSSSIFVSHSKEDHDAVNALTSALRTAFGGRLRTFNTSSGAAIPAGDLWRTYILAALRSAPVVLLWGTSSALQSREVAFEVGAAMAYDLPIITCCVHIAPAALPWGLAERQALIMDSDQGWEQLPDEIASIINFAGAVDKAPLRELADRYEAPGDALDVSALGYTLEFHNRSSTPISDVEFVASDEGGTPEWATALKGAVLEPDAFAVVLRDAESERTVDVTWRDIAGATHRRSFPIPSTPA